MTTMKQFQLKNLDCANCAAKIEKAVQEIPGVRFASVNFATATLHIDADHLSHVQATIRRIEPEIELWAAGNGQEEDEGGGINWHLAAILLAAILMSGGLVFEDRLSVFAYYMIFSSAFILAGQDVLRQAVRNLSNHNWFDESFLMSVATLGAIAIGEFPEAVGVMVFYQIGEFVQEKSVERSRRSIKALLQIKPYQAEVILGDEIELRQADRVDPGMLVMVRPGGKIPLDGVIIEGAGEVNTAAITGESAPRLYKTGEEVLAGMINLSGILKIRVSRPYEQSTAAKMVSLVENAASRKARTEKFITRFAQVYTPIVVGIALVIAIAPPLFLPGASWGDWLHRALVILVISCPCALVISIPLGYFGGIGGASRRGILVKGANYLDVLAKVKTVIFDKTGTLTHGSFYVSEVVPVEGYSENELLALAAVVESPSSHPIAKAIAAAHEKNGFLAVIEAYEEFPGHGIKARVDGCEVLAGNDTFLHLENIAHEICECGGTAVHLAKDGQYLGYLVVSDEIKPESRESIQKLHRLGVSNIVMLSGDRKFVADDVAGKLGVDQVYAELLPEEKVNITEEIIQKADEGTVAFVGDGINDAPVLSRADVGIAMGISGADAAIEAADVVLMTDSPAKVAEAIRLGRRTRQIVQQNIILALLIKMIFIGFGAFGLASMWVAVFADVGVSLLAVLNATRVLR